MQKLLDLDLQYKIQDSNQSGIIIDDMFWGNVKEC